MVAYKVYRHDEENRDDLIVILPERRQDQERISPDAVINWLRTVMGETVGAGKIYFIRVEV